MRQLRVVGGSSVADQIRGTRAVSAAPVTRSIRLWLPLTPLVLLLGPLVMIAAPFAAFTRAGRRINPLRAAWTLGGVLLALSGTQVSVDTAAVQLRIHIL
jgi:hypothetical protein